MSKVAKRVEVTSGQLRELKLMVDIENIPHTPLKKGGQTPSPTPPPPLLHPCILSGKKVKYFGLAILFCFVRSTGVYVNST